MIFEEKYFSCYISLTDQILLVVCLYVVRYWAIYAIVYKAGCYVIRVEIDLIFLIKPFFPHERLFEIKWKPFFLIFKGLPLNQIIFFFGGGRWESIFFPLIFLHFPFFTFVLFYFIITRVLQFKTDHLTFLMLVVGWVATAFRDYDTVVLTAAQINSTTSEPKTLCKIFWKKIKKLTKIRQDRKLWYLFLHSFRAALPRVHFCRGNWTLGWVSTYFSDFLRS